MRDEAHFKQLCLTAAQTARSSNEGDRLDAAIAIVDFLCSAVLSELPAWQSQGHPDPFRGDIVMGHQAILIKDLNDIGELPAIGHYDEVKFYLLNSQLPTPRLAYVKTLRGAVTSGFLDAPLLTRFRWSVLEGLPEGILTSNAVPGPAKHEFRTIRDSAYLVAAGRKVW